MRVLILNKKEFAEFMQYNMIDDTNVESKDIMFISINAYYNADIFFEADLTVNSYFKRQHPNVMIMHFGDYGEDYANRLSQIGPTGVFNEYKANKLYNFIKKNSDKSMAIIHCAAGISRSGAVGTFIYDIYGRDTMTWEEFKRKNPRIRPNIHILKLLQHEFNKDKYNKKI